MNHFMQTPTTREFPFAGPKSPPRLRISARSFQVGHPPTSCFRATRASRCSLKVPRTALKTDSAPGDETWTHPLTIESLGISRSNTTSMVVTINRNSFFGAAHTSHVAPRPSDPLPSNSGWPGQWRASFTSTVPPMQTRKYSTSQSPSPVSRAKATSRGETERCASEISGCHVRPTKTPPAQLTGAAALSSCLQAPAWSVLQWVGVYGRRSRGRTAISTETIPMRTAHDHFEKQQQLPKIDMLSAQGKNTTSRRPP
mmetsp:Transcript_125217/g.401126  ORF Transcript_125217/g.401126 Transcript_125217/m.401126 type:complete len:256 (+) Transcript_125217:1469-2236(+)